MRPARTSLSTDAGRLARVTELISDITLRLRTVCAGMPQPEFDALVRRMAETAVKYEAREEQPTIRPEGQ